MKVIFLTPAQQDFDYWKNNNPKMADRIEELIRNIKLHPFKEIGKPEPLRFSLKGR